jgi:general secretion pathway protein G
MEPLTRNGSGARRRACHAGGLAGTTAGVAGRTARSTHRGFTLIELMIVMTVITVIVSLAVPMYQKAIVRAKESVLRNNLFTLRTLIDEYTFDKQKAPQMLEDLVREGYLRQIPIDPITGSNQTWRVIMEDVMSSVNQTEPGIFDVRSGSDQTSLEGTPYSEW